MRVRIGRCLKEMRLFRAIVAISITICLFATPGKAGISAGMEKIENKADIILGSHDDRISLSSDRGSISAWQPWLPFQPDMEMLRDVFHERGMEGEYVAPSFAHKLLEGEREGTVLLSEALLEEVSSGPDTAGLAFSRRLRLNRDPAYIEVEQILHNNTKDYYMARAGVKNRFFVGQNKGEEVCYLPTKRSVLRVTGGSIDRFYSRTGDWEHYPNGGWLGVINAENRAGIVFVFDGRIVESLYYNSAKEIIGWLVNGGMLKPGEHFSTTYLAVPVKGFNNLSYASRRLIAGIQLSASDSGIVVNIAVAGTLHPLGDVTVKPAVYGVRSGKLLELPAMTFKDVGLKMVDKNLIVNQPQQEPLVIRVKVYGDGWQEDFEDYFEGKCRTTIYPGYPYQPEYLPGRAG